MWDHEALARNARKLNAPFSFCSYFITANDVVSQGGITEENYLCWVEKGYRKSVVEPSLVFNLFFNGISNFTLYIAPIMIMKKCIHRP